MPGSVALCGQPTILGGADRPCTYPAGHPGGHGIAPIEAPTVPVEFPLVVSVPLMADDPGWPGMIGIHRCPICLALLASDGAQGHAEWHRGERMRNWGGF